MRPPVRGGGERREVGGGRGLYRFWGARSESGLGETARGREGEKARRF